MTQFRKVGNHWEAISGTEEKPEIKKDEEETALNTIKQKLTLDKLKAFTMKDAPTDYMLKLYIPRYYNDGTKVSPDVIADILARISDALGGASTWSGKGYWTSDDILYEDKNVYVEILLREMSSERALLLSKYLGSIIAGALKQEGALTVLIPALSDFLDIKDYEGNEQDALNTIKDLNKETEKYLNNHQNDQYNENEENEDTEYIPDDNDKNSDLYR